MEVVTEPPCMTPFE